MSKFAIPPPNERRQEPPQARHGLANVPKPPWAELVAPYAGNRGEPTIHSHLSHNPGWLWAHRGGGNWAIPLAPFIEHYGVYMTLESLRKRLRADGLTIATFGRHNEYRFPPIDSVPLQLRGYARIDPRDMPAPLRWSKVFGDGCSSFTQPDVSDPALGISQKQTPAG